MEFRTPIKIRPSGYRIGYSEKGLSLGSCFAQNIAERMQSVKLPVLSNPFGVLYNPESIANAIEALGSDRKIGRNELITDNGLYASFDFHGCFSSPDSDKALERMNQAIEIGAGWMRQSDYVILTFGTAWVYELDESFYDAFSNSGDIGQFFRPRKVVANCHKFPASVFRRRRMTVGEIVDRYTEIFPTHLSGKHVFLTVSPVRHLKDGFEGNSVSKSVLILAAQELAERFEDVTYFPAYEILNDDLRDYRFYAADMVHPSDVAVDYIWDNFSKFSLSDEAVKTGADIRAVVAAANHRPLNPGTLAHRNFAEKMAAKAESIQNAFPGIDMSSEIAFFRELSAVKE